MVNNVDTHSNTQPNCNCHLSNFKEKFHHHIITGDLNFIINDKIKSLMEKGPKFRIPKFPNKNTLYNNIITDIDDYITRMVKKTKIEITRFQNWKFNLYSKIKKTIDEIKTPLEYNKCNTFNLEKDDINYLDNLHQDFVITSVDKATQNIAIICKKFYIDQIKIELNKNSYSLTNENGDDLITNQRTTSKHRFNIKVHNDNNDLPFLHIIPKFHKNPIKFRPIIASTKAVTKQLSTTLSKILKFITNKMKKYCNTIKKSTRINRFWIIDNNQLIIKTINDLSHKNKIKNIATFDFSTLYTSIPHDELKTALKNVLEIAYHKSNNLKIVNTFNNIYWSYNNNTKNAIDKNKCYDMIVWLIDNTFFKFGNNIYKQIIGIPMGTQCASFLANLFLFHYEYEFLKTQTITNYHLCLKLNLTFRFQDDITTINDDGTFLKHYKDIYPPSLELIKVNNSDICADVLDLSITINRRNKASIDIYDKRNDFNFNVIIFPHMTSNISTDMCYSIYRTQIIRYSTICSNITLFENNVNQLIHKLKSRGFSVHKMFNILSILKRKIPAIKKYYKT